MLTVNVSTGLNVDATVQKIQAIVEAEKNKNENGIDWTPDEYVQWYLKMIG